MAIFPTNKITTTEIPDAVANLSLGANNHTQKHNDMRDEIIAIEAKVGVNNSTDTNSIDYKLTNTASINPGHKHSVSSIDATGTPDSTTYLRGDGTWAGTSVPDASTSVKGITKLSTAPSSPTNPIAVGDNDTRLPTQNENDALVGTSGTPSSTNRYVTQTDGIFLSIFGDGSDGDVTISTNTTLTNDMNYNNLTINNSIILNTAGYRVFVKGTLTNNGIISNDGLAGGNGTSFGVGGATGTLAGGSNGANGAAPNTNNKCGAGGGGGGVVLIVAKNVSVQGTVRALGGNGGNAISDGTAGVSSGNNGNSISMSYIQSGNGGSAAYGSTSGAFTGGIITNYSKISKQVNLLITSLNAATPIGGGAGGAGGGYTSGAAGGGGGGQGGCVIFIYNTITTSGSLIVTGGNGGSGATGGASGGSGSVGRIISLQI